MSIQLLLAAPQRAKRYPKALESDRGTRIWRCPAARFTRAGDESQHNPQKEFEQVVHASSKHPCTRKPTAMGVHLGSRGQRRRARWTAKSKPEPQVQIPRKRSKSKSGCKCQDRTKPMSRGQMTRKPASETSDSSDAIAIL